MDPSTSTRLQFTNQFVSGSVRNDASPRYAKIVQNHKALLDALAHHEAMAPNLHQTYLTPAADENKVHFVWDFVGRTLGILYSINPTLQNLEPKEKADWKHAVGRAAFTKALITDQFPGVLDEMIESEHPEQAGKHPAFGEAIIELAKKLDDVSAEIGDMGVLSA